MALQAIYEKDKFEGEVPEQYRDLYSERDGKMELTGVVGMKTQADLDRVSGGLTKEKNDHKATKAKLDAWNALGLTVDEITQKLDKYPELEAAATGNIDEKKIETIVQGRLKTLTAPLERENKQLKEKAAQQEEQITSFVSKDRARKISDAVRSQAVNLKVIPEAIDDIIMLGERHLEVTDDGKVITREGAGVEVGLSVETWLSDMRDRRPHWWPASQGGGAGGGNGGGSFSNNPWSANHWNLTEQGKVVREKGMTKAQEMAKAAGTTVGGQRPAKAK